MLYKIESISRFYTAFIFDNTFKNYKDLNKASKVSGINFKVPDYVIDGYVADSGINVIKQKDNTT